MRKKNICFPLLLLLMLATNSLAKQTPVSAENSSWDPVERPTISGGTISRILLDPLDSSHLFAFQQQQDLSYVLFESLDSAASWNAIYSFPDFIESAAIDPSTPSILYVATYNAILRSVNNGRVWGKIADYGSVVTSPAGNTLYTIENMHYSSDCPTGNINFVASHDGGSTWNKYFLGCYFIHQISASSSYPARIYIRSVGDFNNSVLLRSNDGGVTWDTIPLNGVWFTHGFYPLAIDPTRPDWLYTSSGSGIIVSGDGGLTWRSVLNISTMGPIRFAFSNGVIYAGVDPVVYGDLPVIYRSTDHGETWETLPWTFSDRLNDLLASDDHPGWLYVAFEGFGIYRSTNGAHSWQAANGGMQSVTIVEKLAVASSHPETIYAISRWPRYALFKTIDGGQTWGTPLLEDRLYTVVVHPKNPEIVWAVDEGGILESVNGGKSWQRVSALQVPDLSVSPDIPDRPCGTSNFSAGSYLVCREVSTQLHKYYWEQSLIPGINNAGKLAISATDGSLMMLIGRPDGASDYLIFRSQDGGQSWQAIFQGPQDYFRININISGDYPAKVLAVFFQAHPDNLVVYQSMDTGESWRDITSQLSEAGGEMWTGWTYKAPVVFDGTGITYFATRDVVLQNVGYGPAWIAVGNFNDLIQDMVLIPASQPSILVSTEKSLWKSLLSAFRPTWIPYLTK